MRPQDKQFTAHLQEWVNTPDAEKDWAEGAILLLQLSGNKIMYANISVNPEGKAEFIKGKLEEYLEFRLRELTHEEVKEMQAKVEGIVANTIKPDMADTDGNDTGKSAEFADFKAGKRADHDTLPDEIKVLYVENLDIVRRMRELHLKLRSLSLEDATCPDSERYPFLKEIINLDKRLHENWDTYDHYVAGTVVPTPDKTDADTAADGEGAATDEARASDETDAPAEETASAPAKKTTKRTTKKKSE